MLRADRIGKRFGPRQLFAGVCLEVRPGDRIGLVGPNGAGKTTLLRILSGDDAPDEGRIHAARGTRLGRLRQEIDPGLDHPVAVEASRAFAHLDGLERELRELETRMAATGRAGEEVPAALAERYDRARTAFELGGGFEREARVARTLAGLGFDEADRARPVRSFSGGWLMRVELAKLLLAQPDVLLLDEPTNHLDLPSIEWFEGTLESFPGGVVVISHDRTFLRRHANRIAELDGGRFTVYELGFDGFLRERALRRELLAARKATQDRKIEATERFIGRFRAKATKARQVQSRVKALAKLERIEVDAPAPRAMRLRIPAPPRAGAVVMRLSAVHKRYGSTRVYRGIDFEVRRGDRIALVGPNGAGKSTLLRILAGVLPIDDGERVPGHNVRVSFFAQHQLEALDPGRTVLDQLAGEARGEDLPRLRGHLGAFLFSGDDVEKRVSVLSGGEKARLALARMLLRPSNFLVLDEPTNHLDLAAREVLEEALRGYRGTLVFISHDRAFIDALATRVVEVRAGRLSEVSGGYDAYLRRNEAVGAGAIAGHGAPRAALVDERPRATGAPDDARPGADAAFARTPAPAREARIAARAAQKERRRAPAKTARRLAELEARIPEAERALEEVGHRLSDPAVYRDGDRVRELSARQAELRASIDGLYRDWERVAAELESLASVLD